jgi:pimeloyl-ACP methyl ester carboxylesterase
VAFTNQAAELAAAKKALPGFPRSVLTLVPQAPRIIPECRVWNVGRANSSAFAPTHSDVPALLLTGTLDAVTPPSQAYLAARTLSRSTVVPIRGFGHDTFDASTCAQSITRGFFDKPTGGYRTACAKRLKDPTFTTG